MNDMNLIAKARKNTKLPLIQIIVIGWSMSSRLKASLVTDALTMGRYLGVNFQVR